MKYKLTAVCMKSNTSVIVAEYKTIKAAQKAQKYIANACMNSYEFVIQKIGEA